MSEEQSIPLSNVLLTFDHDDSQVISPSLESLMQQPIISTETDEIAHIQSQKSTSLAISPINQTNDSNVVENDTDDNLVNSPSGVQDQDEDMDSILEADESNQLSNIKTGSNTPIFKFVSKRDDKLVDTVCSNVNLGVMDVSDESPSEEFYQSVQVPSEVIIYDILGVC